MPTSRRRVGFLPRREVQEILDELSKEENLSQSKVVGILVEEALHYRGIFDKKNGKRLNLNPSNKISANSLMKGNSAEALEIIDELRKDNPNTKIEVKSRIKTNVQTEDMIKKYADFLKFQELMENN
tara:strand:- start:399 stop:779 length:381 start_codon:yes stop_codon:yes gene_type:complete